MSKIQNSIWIKNTNKTGQETMNLLKLLKDLGVFKEKPKKRKPKRKEEVFEDEEILQQPSGGGGGGGSDMGGGNITSNLLALKGALSAKNTDEENIKKLKDATELQLGKLRDAQQDLTRTQQRFAFGYKPEQPRIDWLEEETGQDFFPDKSVVVPETNYEMNREGASINIPDEVMEQDVSAQVSPEQGQMEDLVEEEVIPELPKPKAVSIDDDYKQALPYISQEYSVRPFTNEFLNQRTNNELKEIISQLTLKLTGKRATYLAGTNNARLKERLKKLIVDKYKADMEQVE
jgi:hypothetical protein